MEPIICLVVFGLLPQPLDPLRKILAHLVESVKAKRSKTTFIEKIESYVKEQSLFAWLSELIMGRNGERLRKRDVPCSFN
jgi:hypothetical protein